MPGSAVPLKEQTLGELFREDVPQPKWLIESILREGGALMVYGPAGKGKTWLVHTLILLALHGQGIGVRDTEAEVGNEQRWVLKAGDHAPIKVGLLDGEMVKAEIKERFRLLCEGLQLQPGGNTTNGLPPMDPTQLQLAMLKGGATEADIKVALRSLEPSERMPGDEDENDEGRGQARVNLDNVVMYLKTDQDPRAHFPDLADDLWKTRIIEFAKSKDLKVLVFDNLATLSPSLEDENAATAWAPLNDLIVALKREGIATIIVHHAGKGGNFRGSSNIVTTLESVINLKAVSTEDAVCKDARFNVEVEKSRAHGTCYANGKTLRLSDNRWKVEIDHTAMSEKVARLIKHCDYTTQGEVALALGITQGQVSKILAKAYAIGTANQHDMNACFKKAKMLRANPEAFFSADDGLTPDEKITLDI